MLEMPEEIKELFRQDNIREETRRKWKLRFFDSDISLLFPEDILFPSDDLFPVDQEPIYVIDNTQMLTESVTLIESICESDDLIFGMCNAAQFEVTVADVLMDLTGKEFMVTVEVGGYEMAMGIYRVTSFQRRADRRLKQITAYDRMHKFRTDVVEWYQGLSFPMSLKEFRDSLCAYVGIKQIDATLPLDSMTVTKTIDPAKLFGLDVLQGICEINGCFGHIDKTGRLRYQFLASASLFPSEELFPDDELFPSGMSENKSETLHHYRKSKTQYEDYVVMSIDCLQIRQEEGDVGAVYGQGKNRYIIQGNFLLYGKSADELSQIAAIIYEQISGKIYRPCRIVAPALPWVEVGDGIICYTTDDVIETYCLKRTMSGIQSMADTYEAFGNVMQEEDFGIHTQIIQLAGKTAVIKKSVEEVSVKVTDLKEYTEAQIKILSDDIILEVTRAKGEEEKLSASIELQAGQIAMKVSKGDVSSQLSIEPDAINLKTNRLSWESDYSSMTQDGTLTCRNLRAINGYFSGVLESEYMGGNDDGAYLGDYSVSANGTNVLQSSNGFVKIDCNARPVGSPGGAYASLYIGGDSYGGVTLNGGTGKIECGEMSCLDVKAINCNLAHGSSRIWGLGETIDWFWDEFEELRNRVDNMS